MIIEGPLLIEPKRHVDERGFFAELYNKSRFHETYGLDVDWKQDNHSVSLSAGTLRGFHFQAPPHAQAKLVRCGRGSIFDVVVDIRTGSPTYGSWRGFTLSEHNGHQLYIPIGFAHGFLTLEPDSEIVYKCSSYYAPGAEGSLRWNDPDLKVVWPLSTEPVLSAKDADAPFFKDFKSPFIWREE